MHRFTRDLSDRPQIVHYYVDKCGLTWEEASQIAYCIEIENASWDIGVYAAIVNALNEAHHLPQYDLNRFARIIELLMCFMVINDEFSHDLFNNFVRKYEMSALTDGVSSWEIDEAEKLIDNTFIDAFSRSIVQSRRYSSWLTDETDVQASMIMFIGYEKLRLVDYMRTDWDNPYADEDAPFATFEVVVDLSSNPLPVFYDFRPGSVNQMEGIHSLLSRLGDYGLTADDVDVYMDLDEPEVKDLDNMAHQDCSFVARLKLDSNAARSAAQEGIDAGLFTKFELEAGIGIMGHCAKQLHSRKSLAQVTYHYSYDGETDGFGSFENFDDFYEEEEGLMLRGISILATNTPRPSGWDPYRIFEMSENPDTELIIRDDLLMYCASGETTAQMKSRFHLIFGSLMLKAAFEYRSLQGKELMMSEYHAR